MIERWKNVERMELCGRDGELGAVDDALVDDRWVVRYLVVAPGALLRQPVVISPIAVTAVDWSRRRVDLRLTRQQVRESPDLLSVAPLTRHAEATYAAFYGYPAYWAGPDLWALAGRPGALDTPPPESDEPRGPDGGTVVLQSVKRLRGRHLHAEDGPIGHVDDAFVDDVAWTLTHVLVDTSNLIGGRHVLLPTIAIRGHEQGHDERALEVQGSAARIRDAPSYDATGPIDATTAREVARHYGTPSTAARGSASNRLR